MDVYKNYLYEMTKVEYQTPYLMVIWEYPPLLFKRYIPMLMNVPFEENNYHIYYGQLKTICTSLRHCYSTCVYIAIKNCERFSNVLTYSEMMELFHRTIDIHNTNHQRVLDEFKPIKSNREQQQLDEIISLHTDYMGQLLKLGDHISFFHKEIDVLDWAKDHFEMCVQRTHQMGELTREFASKIMAKNLHRIRISLEDLVQRIKYNSDTFEKAYDRGLRALFHEMYDRNKQSLQISRREHRDSTDIVEIENEIETIRDKIQNFGNFETFDRLASEIGHWSETLNAFEEIAAVIKKVKTALDKARAQLEIHQKHKSTDLPGARNTCWDVMGVNFQQVVDELEKKYHQACIPIYSFFACKGIDLVYYVDRIGTYFVDLFGHKNYVTQFGMKIFHVNCDGEFVENTDDEKYYFDECGRYLLENEEKIYQLAPCTSKFKMNDQGLFEKCEPCSCHDKCGGVTHSCFIDVPAMMNPELLPKTEPVDIEGTLDNETVKYLWNTFGHILPEVLCEVAEMRPKNPIHQMAHLLLNKRFNMTPNQMREKKKEAAAYRSKIVTEREEKIDAMLRNWKSKQLKRVKPEDLDMLPEIVLTQFQQMEQQQLIDCDALMRPLDPAVLKEPHKNLRSAKSMRSAKSVRSVAPMRSVIPMRSVRRM